MAKPAVTYSREVADLICDRIAEGVSLKSICEADGMPSSVTVRTWVRKDVDGFRARYEVAMEVGCDAIADEMRHLTDNAKPEDAPLLHVKLRALTYLLGRWHPRKYGERPPMPAGELPPIEIRLIAPSGTLPAPIEGEFWEVHGG